MDYRKIVDKIVIKLNKEKIPFYSCGLLFCSNKKIKPKIEVVIKRPQRFDTRLIKKIPRGFMGLKVKVV